MDKKAQKAPVSLPSSPETGKSTVPAVKSYALRDVRAGTYDMTLDAATERVWRNCQYPERVLFEQYFRMYSRNNVAARVIETFPDYSWSATPFVTDEGGDKSRFSKAVTKMLGMQYKLQDGVKQSLLTSMKQLDVLGGIGGESLLVFGFSDDKKLDQPVSGAAGTTISWVKLLHNGQFTVDKRDTNENSATFGDIVHYKTKDFTDNGDLNFVNQIAANKLLHASRCVHFKETAGLSYGTSRIQKCYNQLLDITKLSGASAEVYWLGAFSGLSIETDPMAQLDEDAYKQMKLDAAMYFDGLARALVLEGASVKQLYPAIVSPKDHFDLQITMISIATGIPRRFLTGAEAAKLASQQDTLNWMERVTNRREMFVGPKVVSPVVQRCIDAGVIPKPLGGTFIVAWPRIQSLALNERADAARNMTAAWNNYGASGMSKVMSFEDYLLYACGFSESEAFDIGSKIKESGWAEVQKLAAAAKAPAPSTEKSGGTGDSAPSDLEERIVDLEHQLAEQPTPTSPGAQERAAQTQKAKRRGES